MNIVKEILAWLLAPHIKGSHVIVRENHRALKCCRPKPLVRLIYLILCHRWHSPYETRAGMERAMVLRRIANHVTSFRLGRMAFALPIGVEDRRIDGQVRPVLVTQWVEGQIVPKGQAQFSIKRVQQVLLKAGFVTWSFANPKSHEDVWFDGLGRPTCVDLESVLPAIFVSLEELGLMWRAGRLFSIDYVDINLLIAELVAARKAGYQYWPNFAEQVKELARLNLEGGF